MSQTPVRSGESSVPHASVISAAVHRLQSKLGETISRKGEWRALLDEVRISGEQIDISSVASGEPRAAAGNH